MTKKTPVVRIKKVKGWRVGLRALIADAMTVPLSDLAQKTDSNVATANMIDARDRIVRYVEKLLPKPNAKRRSRP